MRESGRKREERVHTHTHTHIVFLVFTVNMWVGALTRDEDVRGTLQADF
jgi:hypothetical protein